MNQLGYNTHFWAYLGEGRWYKLRGHVFWFERKATRWSLVLGVRDPDYLCVLGGSFTSSAEVRDASCLVLAFVWFSRSLAAPLGFQCQLECSG
jgi:hypothetical protein